MKMLHSQTSLPLEGGKKKSRCNCTTEDIVTEYMRLGTIGGVISNMILPVPDCTSPPISALVAATRDCGTVLFYLRVRSVPRSRSQNSDGACALRFKRRCTEGRPCRILRKTPRKLRALPLKVLYSNICNVPIMTASMTKRTKSRHSPIIHINLFNFQTCALSGD